MTDIDIAKGIAISLVVFGHIVARQPPVDNEWYVIVKQAIYSFHMAFFMYLSGIVYFLKIETVRTWKEYGRIVIQRFTRLMPAYFIFAGLVFFAKWGSQNFLYVDNPVIGWYDLVEIFIFPMQSVASFLWYVYVLFLFSAFGVGFFSLTRGRIFPLVLVGVILLFFAPKFSLLGFDQFCKYLLFFALGGLAIRHWSTYIKLVKYTWLFALIGFILMLINSKYFGIGWVPTALLSLIALHGLCRQKFMNFKFLKYLGLMSFPIYLMNTLSIGFFKAFMFKFISWHGTDFLFYAPILTLSGLIVPIVFKKYIIKRVGWLDKITT